MNIALIIAGGCGERMKQDIPKQFLTVDEKPIIVYTLEAFQKNAQIDVIAVVSLSGWNEVLKVYAEQFDITKLKHVVEGGDCGQASIRNGVYELEKYYKPDDIVLVHDAIRPLVSQEIISDCIVTAKQYGSAISSIPCAEAMLQTDDAVISSGSYPRDGLKRAQTPQGFPLGKLGNYHREALKRGITNSVASCTLAVELGDQVYFSAGSTKNIKLTTVDDFDIFKALLTSKRESWMK